MTKTLIKVFLVAALFFVQNSYSCEYQFKNLDLCFDLSWDGGPEVNEDSPFTLSFTNKSGEKLSSNPNELDAKIWMPFMDHGSAPLKWEFSTTGVATFSNVWFIMDGYWELIVKVQGDEVKVPIEL